MKDVTRREIAAKEWGEGDNVMKQRIHASVRSAYSLIRDLPDLPDAEGTIEWVHKAYESSATLLVPKKPYKIDEMEMILFWESYDLPKETEPYFGSMFYTGKQENNFGKAIGFGFQFNPGPRYTQMITEGKHPFYSIDALSHTKKFTTYHYEPRAFSGNLDKFEPTPVAQMDRPRVSYSRPHRMPDDPNFTKLKHSLRNHRK